MGVRILYDREADNACLFCSTTDVVFGPVFQDGPEHDADERAEAFCRWFESDACDWFAYESSHARRDLRCLTDAGLMRAYYDWGKQEAAQYLRENPPSCEHCGEPIGTCDADCPSHSVKA